MMVVSSEQEGRVQGYRFVTVPEPCLDTLLHPRKNVYFFEQFCYVAQIGLKFAILLPQDLPPSPTPTKVLRCPVLKPVLNKSYSVHLGSPAQCYRMHRQNNMAFIVEQIPLSSHNSPVRVTETLIEFYADQQ